MRPCRGSGTSDARRGGRGADRSRSLRLRRGTRRSRPTRPRADRPRRHHVRVLPVPVRHRADHGQGRPGEALGDDRGEGVPARVRRDRQPLRRPARRLHRVRPRGRRARRDPRAGDVHAAPLGREGRTRVVPVLPQPRGAPGPGRAPHLGQPREPQAAPGRVRGEDWTAPSRRHRARDDVAQAEARRHAGRRRRDEALLLPHRPVLGAPADHPQGDRVRAGDGPGHDPGRPRGRTGSDRAQLQLRPGRGDGRQPLDVPPDLPPGGPRARRLPLLHAQAVHGGLRKRLPPQHLALGRRPERLRPRHGRPPEAEPDGALRDRRGSSSTSARSPRSPRRL